MECDDYATNEICIQTSLQSIKTYIQDLKVNKITYFNSSAKDRNLKKQYSSLNNINPWIFADDPNFGRCFIIESRSCFKFPVSDDIKNKRSQSRGFHNSWNIKSKNRFKFSQNSSSKKSSIRPKSTQAHYDHQKTRRNSSKNQALLDSNINLSSMLFSKPFTLKQRVKQNYKRQCNILLRRSSAKESTINKPRCLDLTISNL